MNPGEISKNDRASAFAPAHYWEACVKRTPSLRRQEEGVEASDKIILQGTAYDQAIIILRGNVREEIRVHHDGMIAVRELRTLPEGSMAFAEALSEEYACAPARYSVIAETRARIVRVDRSWLTNMGLLRGPGHFEHDLRLDQIRLHHKLLDAIENILRELIEAERPRRILNNLIEPRRDRTSLLPDAPNATDGESLEHE